jgi:tyrosine-protein kinase Etk/Wzc
MSSVDNYTDKSGDQQARFLTFKEIIFKYISNLPLFFFSLGAAMLIAWSYLRWSTPVYNVSSSMMIKEESSANIKGDQKFSSIF